MGEEEVARVVLPEGVEVAGLDVDAGAFDLQVDEGVGPEVVADLGVLHVEEARGGVVGVGGEAGEVAHVGAYLHAQGVAEEREVGIDGVLAGQQRHVGLDLVGGVLEDLQHVEVQPAPLEAHQERGLAEPEVAAAADDGQRAVVPHVVIHVRGADIEVDEAEESAVGTVAESRAETLREDGVEGVASGMQHANLGQMPQVGGTDFEGAVFGTVEGYRQGGERVEVGFLDFGAEAEEGVVERGFAVQGGSPEAQVDAGEGVDGCRGDDGVGCRGGVLGHDGTHASGRDTERDFQRVAPAVVGVGIVGPEEGGAGIVPEDGVGIGGEIGGAFPAGVVGFHAQHAPVDDTGSAHAEGVDDHQGIHHEDDAVGTHGVVARHQRVALAGALHLPHEVIGGMDEGVVVQALGRGVVELDGQAGEVGRRVVEEVAVVTQAAVLVDGHRLPDESRAHLQARVAREIVGGDVEVVVLGT